MADRRRERTRDALAELADAEPADRLRALVRSALLMAGIRGGLVLAAEDPSFPLRGLEDVLLSRVLGGR